RRAGRRCTACRRPQDVRPETGQRRQPLTRGERPGPPARERSGYDVRSELVLEARDLVLEQQLPLLQALQLQLVEGRMLDQAVDDVVQVPVLQAQPLQASMHLGTLVVPLAVIVHPDPHRPSNKKGRRGWPRSPLAPSSIV